MKYIQKCKPCPIFPSAMVFVSSNELLHQIVSVIKTLWPEYSASSSDDKKQIVSTADELSFHECLSALSIENYTIEKKKTNYIFRPGKHFQGSPILIATPSAFLNEDEKRVNLLLKHLRFVVFDEADFLLGPSGEKSLFEWIKRIINSRDKSKDRLNNINFIYSGATLRNINSKKITAWNLIQKKTKIEFIKSKSFLSLPKSIKEEFIPVQIMEDVTTKFHDKIMKQMQNFHVKTPHGFRPDAETGGVDSEAVADFYANYVKRKRSETEHSLEMFYSKIHALFNSVLNSNTMAIPSKSQKNRIIIFANTIQRVKMIFDELSSLNTGNLLLFRANSDSKLSLNERLSNLENFINCDCTNMQTLNILITTDLYARGIDFNGADINLIVQFDLIPILETYLHRAGRTARQNRPGHVITLYEEREKDFIQKINFHK